MAPDDHVGRWWHNVALQEIKEEVLQLAKSFGWREDGSSSTPTSSSLFPVVLLLTRAVLIIIRGGGGARGSVVRRKHRLCLQAQLVRHTTLCTCIQAW
jgi:hypothetical protein